MFEELKTSITSLDLDILITFITAIGIIFFGITDDIRNKTFRLKNILILYISLFIILIFSSSSIGILPLIILGCLAGGIIFLHDQNNDLEKELGIFNLLTYYSLTWILLNKTYIWIMCCLLLMILNINQPIILSLYQNKFFSIDKELIQVFIIAIFMLYHYSKVAISFFDFYNFNTGLDNLKISLNKDIIQKEKEPQSRKDLYKEVDSKMDLLCFLLFMEDKNMFNRNTPYITIYTDFILSKLSKERETFFPNIEFNDKRKRLKKPKKFVRGYSTIEQQFLRQHILKPNSYRYKIRRTLLIKLYTKYFFKSICKRKSMTYSRNKIKNRKYAKMLRKNLKYHFLVIYFLTVLENPKNEEELFKIMSQNSRVSATLYEKIYIEFVSSSLLTKYKSKIIAARDSNYKFLLKE
ncbi:hypothetical protein CN888_27240 [Bacillus wiedmannii]|uniref:hypothetical protein n=1 Tax=Bacillus wiedmannii TaxID=1890302 RepID=UPI000BEF5DBE|nr:hypothetical protein [Bacillus wiedmannii]PEJ68719.1 hypothetical protein CN888_27240 [Bacillus wiedmannii]